MPLAMVIPLTAETAGELYGATGQHAHGFWLNSWRAVHPATGDALHDADDRLRPFALSPLLGLPRPSQGRTPVATGAVAWLRVCALDDATVARLLGDWLPRAPERAEIGGVVWRLGRPFVRAAEHPAAGRAGFGALADAFAANPPTRWTLDLVTPTALHQREGTYLPFPLPERLAMGWLDRWRECGGGELPALAPARLEVGLRVSGFELRTISARYWRRGPDGRRREWPQIGCVGRLALDGRALSPAERAAVSSLVAFAFFCGSGHHTTMGMGGTNYELGIRN